MKLNLTPIPSNRFTYCPDLCVLSTERSDLKDFPTIFNPLYDDACDVGIAIQSTKTGKIVTFYFETAVKDGEGETLSWKFLPAKDFNMNVSYPYGLKVIIFND